MRPETRQSLTDAKAAAEEVTTLATPSWQEDRTKALAIERLLMIVGEAFVRIRSSKEGMLEQITDAYKIIGMRNVLVHGYDALDPARVQDAIEQSLPKLNRELDGLLS